ncbi:MAG: hypothetical protein EA359_09705 [Balneolaceae bacterium]|nr:MAG: hypothetical protein EA359_09705 [Balneolaceae bacterium]
MFIDSFIHQIIFVQHFCNVQVEHIYLSSYPSKISKQGKERLRWLHTFSNQGFLISESPENADLILISHPGNDLSKQEYLTELQTHPLITRYPEKCFTVSFFKDKPLLLNRGIYESPIKLWRHHKRFKTGAYLSHLFNPFIVKAVNSGHESVQMDRRYLASFIGRRSHSLRVKIFNQTFKRPDIIIRDSSGFNAWSKKTNEENKKDHEQYLNILSQSKFAICPRGAGSSSIRLFEAMSLGICPVIISDEWVPPAGPDWNEFCIFLKESEIDDLESVLEVYEDECFEMGKKAFIAYWEYFSDEKYFDYLINCCVEIKGNQQISEAIYWKFKIIQVIRYILYYWIKKKRLKLYWAVMNMKSRLFKLFNQS